MHIGFTGTREGMTAKQIAQVEKIVSHYVRTTRVVHHGDCIGADTDFHHIVVSYGLPVIVHPPTNERHRAFNRTGKITERPPLGYLERNKAIVDEVALLIATPRTREPELRSGTWSTVRYAHRVGCSVTIVYP